MREDVLAIPRQGNSPLRLELAGISYCDGSYRIHRDPGPTCVFEYVERGSGTLQVENQYFYPREHDLYIAPSWKHHEYRSSAENPWTKYWFNLSGPLVEHLLKAFSLEETYLFHHAEIPGNLLKKTVETLKIILPERRVPFMGTMFFRLIRELGRLNRNETWDAPPRSAKLVAYLRANIMNPAPSLEDMALRMGLSPVQTIRVFREENGKTPYDFLLSEKMEAALELLRATRKPVKEIADMLGFRDPYYFSRIFRRKNGFSPTDVRK